MKNLNAYVQQKNRWNAIFKGKQFDLDNPSDRQAIANSIDSELSPENLTCDGELSRSQVNARYRQLAAAARELQKLDPAIKFYEFA